MGDVARGWPFGVVELRKPALTMHVYEHVCSTVSRRCGPLPIVGSLVRITFFLLSVSTVKMSAPLPPSAYESKVHVPFAAVVVTLTIATAAVSLRTYTRGYMIRQFGMDDWAAIVALVFAMASGIMVATSLCSSFSSSCLPVLNKFRQQTAYTALVVILWL